MKAKTLNIVYISVFSVLIAVCSWISVPAAVPFTMQTFAVFACVGLLGTLRGSLSVIIYLLLGMVGLPIFSGFRGGVGVLLGSTGGYLIGFLFAAVVTGVLLRFFGKGLLSVCLSMAVGQLIVYAFGTVWFSVLYSASPAAVLLTCVVPFIIPDTLKLILAAVTTVRLRRFVIQLS